jgi:hypothetical protein
VWRRLFECPDYAKVAADTVVVMAGTVEVYTFWLGIADAGQRLIFRTVMLRTGHPSLIWGWTTEDEARTGHRAVRVWLTAGGDMPPGLLWPTGAPPDRAP